MNRKILLIEPNYGNKFPPVGLMKIATYFKNLKDDVTFYKGDLDEFVNNQLTEDCIKKFSELDSSVNWRFSYRPIFNFIRYGRKEYLEQINVKQSKYELLLNTWLDYYKDQFKKKGYKNTPKYDFVGVTTLFTFYWKITVDTINFVKDLVKDKNNVMVGGVLASIQPNELSEATGIPIHQHGHLGGIHVGTLKPGDLDADDSQPIDELELDYSILDEIDYKYEMSNAYYRYTTRGCVNKCAFCAVPTLEPEYLQYIPLKDRIDIINKRYGEQKDLLLMDNNVLASDDYPRIIQEIIDCGFEKGAKYTAPNILDITMRNLKDGINDRAYIRKSWTLINELYMKVKDDNSFTLYKILDKYNILQFYTATKQNLIDAYEELKEIWEKYRPKSKGVMRFVDFNQGMDARLFTPEKAELLSRIAIRPVRIAFDDIKTEKKYCEAIRMCAKVGIKDFSNYLLYNFRDYPVDLYKRMRINVDLCEELAEETGLPVNIYSFPMKFHPIKKTKDMTEDFSHNRDYIGTHWNRKFIRAVQAILNSTKGKIGRGISFFNKAFGKDEEEFAKILRMPETMLIYRFFFEWMNTEEAKERAIELLGDDSICHFSVENWWNCYLKCQSELSIEEWQKLENKIFTNDFNGELVGFNELEMELLSYYTCFRKDIITSGTPMYIMRLEYEKNPLIASRFNKKLDKNSD